MEFTGYQIILLALMLVAHTAGAVIYISKIKNDLATRVAVLEAGHSLMTSDLREIKKDVKELLAWINSQKGK